MTATPVTADPERRRLLLAAKLRALLKLGWPSLQFPDPAPAAGGVTVATGSSGWALVDDADVLRGFARALLWGVHRDLAELHILIDDHPELAAAARQAACVTGTVTVWAVRGGVLRPVEAEALPVEPPVDRRAEPFRDVIIAAGRRAGRGVGSAKRRGLGLPVARVCVDDDGAWLEVGIGKHDRLANRMAWGDEPPAAALLCVVAPVFEARRSGDLTHPFNQLCRERWLRAVLQHDPDLAGLDTLTPSPRRAPWVTSESRSPRPPPPTTPAAGACSSPARSAATRPSSRPPPSSTRRAPPTCRSSSSSPTETSTP
jgi:hypothetical protein